MAAAISGNQTYQTDTTNTVYTLSSYTPAAGSNRILVVRVNALRTSETGAFTVDSVTFGGVSLTQAIQANTTSTARTYRSAIFYLINPSSSAGDVVVTLSHAASSCIISADTLTGAAQSSPVGQTGSSTATPTASIADTSDEAGSIGIMTVTTRCQGGTPSWTFSDSGGGKTYVEQYDIAVVPSDNTEVAGAGGSVIGPNTVVNHQAVQSLSNSQIAVYAEFKAAFGISGTASIAQAGNTVSSASTVKIAGTSSVTQAANTLSSAAGLRLAGTLDIVESSNALSSAAVLELSGAADITQDSNTLSAVGTEPLFGTVTVTQDDNTLSAAGSSLSTGALSITQDGDTLSAAAVSPLTGAASITQDGDTLLAVLSIGLFGVVDIAQDDNTLDGVGVIGDVPLSAEAEITQDGNTLSSAGVTSIAAVVSLAQDDNTVTSGSALLLSGVAGVTQDGDTLTADGELAGTGLSLSVTQDDNTLSAAGELATYGQLVIEQYGNALVSAGVIAINGAVDIAQDDNTLLSTGSVSYYGVAVIMQDDNTLSATGDLDRLAWSYEGTVEYPNHTGVVYYPAPVGEVMASGDIDNIEL